LPRIVDDEIGPQLTHKPLCWLPSRSGARSWHSSHGTAKERGWIATVASTGHAPSAGQEAGGAAYPTRRYRRTKRQQGPRWWRTRPDPFAAVWDEVAAWLAAQPERTAKSIFVALQQGYPGQFPDVQLRTLQRRVQVWRADALLTFDDQWLQEDLLVPSVLPAPLRALSLARSVGAPDELPLAAEGR